MVVVPPGTVVLRVQEPRSAHWQGGLAHAARRTRSLLVQHDKLRLEELESGCLWVATKDQVLVQQL